MEPKTPETTPSPVAAPVTPVEAPTSTAPSPTPPVSAPAATTATPLAQQKGGGHSTLIAIILLILLYPIGLLYTLMKTGWPKWLKLLLSLPFILGIIGGILFGFKSILFH